MVSWRPQSALTSIEQSEAQAGRRSTPNGPSACTQLGSPCVEVHTPSEEELVRSERQPQASPLRARRAGARAGELLRALRR